LNINPTRKKKNYDAIEKGLINYFLDLRVLVFSFQKSNQVEFLRFFSL